MDYAAPLAPQASCRGECVATRRSDRRWQRRRGAAAAHVHARAVEGLRASGAAARCRHLVGRTFAIVVLVLVLAARAPRADAQGGINSCALDTGECSCKADDAARCLELAVRARSPRATTPRSCEADLGYIHVQPLFAVAGTTCNDASLQGSFEACKSGNIGAEYCIWCNSSHSVHKRCLTRCEPPTVGVATGRFSDRTA